MFSIRLLFIAALAAVAHASPINATVSGNATALAVGRRDPPLRGGFIEHCSRYSVLFDQFAAGQPINGIMSAICDLTPDAEGNSQYISNLDLNLCMGNYDNHLAWGYLGGAMASCKCDKNDLKKQQILHCDCGKIDLNEGIYVSENSAIACYDQIGQVTLYDKSRVRPSY